MSDQHPIPADPIAAAQAANRMIANGQGGTMIPSLGLEYLEVGPERIVARIPVEQNTQPYGLLHGGGTPAPCETVASFGPALVAGGGEKVTGGGGRGENPPHPPAPGVGAPPRA